MICNVRKTYMKAAADALQQERIDIEGHAGNSCMLDVEFQCILSSRSGITRMPCVDMQESLDWQR